MKTVSRSYQIILIIQQRAQFRISRISPSKMDTTTVRRERVSQRSGGSAIHSVLIYWCTVLMDRAAPKRAVKARPYRRVYRCSLFPECCGFRRNDRGRIPSWTVAPTHQPERHTARRVSIRLGIALGLPCELAFTPVPVPVPARHVRQTSLVYLNTWGKSSASQDMRVPFIFPRTRFPPSLRLAAIISQVNRPRFRKPRRNVIDRFHFEASSHSDSSRKCSNGRRKSFVHLHMAL